MALKINIKDIKIEHCGKDLETKGFVRESSAIKIKLVIGSFDCIRCGNVQKVEQIEEYLLKPTVCESCKSKKSFKLCEEESTFTNYQKLLVEDNNDSAPHETIEVILEDDLPNGNILAGDTVRVVGTVKIIQRNVRSKKLDGFNLRIKAKSIEKL